MPNRTKIYIAKQDIEDCMAKHMTYKEMAKLFGCSHWTVMTRANEYGLHSYARKCQQKQNNCSKQPETKEKISKSIQSKWVKEFYKDRINGMIGMTGCNHPNYQGDIQKRNYRTKALFYNRPLICPTCGEPIDPNSKYDVHHVDENHDNCLLTNLEVLHVPCHQKYHTKNFKMPFVSVTKKFEFEAGHYIPDHYADCKYVHGHSYKLEVTVRHRINPDTGMSLDFKRLSGAVKHNVVEVLDHAFINDWMEVPTAENMVFWIWEKLSIDVKGITKIRLYETASSYAEITTEDVLEMVNSCDLESNWLDEQTIIDHKKFMEKQLTRDEEKEQ